MKSSWRSLKTLDQILAKLSMKREMKFISPLLLLMIIILANGCSTQKNTASSRWWHSFNANYNTYYNGTLAYIDGSLQKEQGNKDNFTEIIPLYTVGNKGSIELGKADFDRTIQKCEKAIHLHSITRRPIWDKKRRKTDRDIEWLNRREYNPFLWKAWLLMGRSQFHSGKFEDAASTFSYMSRLYHTQPAIYGKARAWLAKSYIEEGWLYDAEDVIRNMRRDSLDWRAVKEWDYTLADYYIHTGEYAQAIPYLRKVIQHEMRRKQRAREWYLLGQLHSNMGQKEMAYKAFKKVIRQSPPYEMEFNARIAMTEVMAGGQARKMISRLKNMAASDKNKDYLDQVFYAIGNIYLTERDTLNAIQSYEQGNRKSVHNGIEKGVLLLRLGNLYWEKEDFSNASRCYNEAIGLLDKDRKDYQQLSDRAAKLEKLVPHIEAIHLQDSLQSLAKMNEKDRNAAIDRVIEALKKKEKELKNALAEQNAQQSSMQNGSGQILQQTPTTMPQGNDKNQQWYFYNPTVVNQGKITFQQLWGKRANVDNWQRINKTVVAGIQTPDMASDAMRDSLIQVEEKKNSLKQVMDSAQNDPHKREYYMAQIPFMEEQIKASNLIIQDALYNAGVIFKDQLDNPQLSERNLRRLSDNYPDYEHMDDAYYYLFLLYSRMGQPAIADGYIRLLQSKYPKSQWTVLLTDPFFKENARLGTHIEDSLYASTYNAFKEARYGEVKNNTQMSDTRFPTGANRDKFIFISGLSKLNDGDTNGCLSNMKEVVTKFPESQLAEMAGMIINGVKAGRQLRGGKFDMETIWKRRSVVLSDSDSIAARTFSPDRNAPFSFILAYSPDSLNENQLLFELAKFNFTSFLVRNFDLNIENIDGLHRMKISGFQNYDEALQYARQLYSQTNILPLLNKSRGFVISEPNLELLGNQYSYSDYEDYYAKHFLPLKVSTYRLLTEPADIEVHEKTTPTPEEINRTLDDQLMNEDKINEPVGNGGTLIIPNEPETTPPNKGTTIVPNNNQQQVTPVDTHTTIIPNQEVPAVPQMNTNHTVKPVEKTEPSKDNGQTQITISPLNQPTGTTISGSNILIPDTPSQPKQTVSPTPSTAKQPTPKPVVTPTPQRSRTGIYFDDGKTGNAETNKKNSTNTTDKRQQDDKQKKTYNLEDEYYDLDGF